MKYRRFGKFHLGWDIIDNNPELAREVFANLIVIEATAKFYSNGIEYVAIGDCFDVVSIMDHPGNYEIELKKVPGKSGVYSFKGFRKIE
jgi:hypothetical protein